eukprot:748265-Hanusia_phi.AAC.1
MQQIEEEEEEEAEEEEEEEEEILEECTTDEGASQPVLGIAGDGLEQESERGRLPSQLRGEEGA